MKNDGYVMEQVLSILDLFIPISNNKIITQNHCTRKECEMKPHSFL